MALIEVRTQALLFDMDGVLISSIESANRCWRQWAAMHGVPDATHFQIPHGVPSRDIVRQLRPDMDPDVGLREIEDLEMADVADVRALPGVREMLLRLPPERWAVVTSATRRLLEVRLRAAGLPEPSALISADMVTRGKPDAEPYRRGAEALGFAPEECVVVEDAVSGVASGLAAGCRVLALLSSTPAEQLLAANWIAESLERVMVAAGQDGLTLSIPLADV